MARRALVVGGTGPTGPYVVRGLIERGHEVAILHRGTHEVDEIPPQVEHIHTDPYDRSALGEALGTRTFDIAIVMYGRLRDIAEVLVGRTPRLIGVGGAPLYRGYFTPEHLFPRGLPVPVPESWQLVEEPEEIRKGYMIRRTEEVVFAAHPDATMLRYPYVYGPRQLMPREWCIVRRALDARPHIILPDGGLALDSLGYVENLAHALMLAVDQPGPSAGQAYNCGDERTLSLRQMTEVIADALEHDWEIISVPAEVAHPARPLMAQLESHHRVLDLSKLRSQLGYRDVVPPEEALRRTARWLREHPLPPGGEAETILQDPFDYAAEDRLVEAWRKGMELMRAVEYARLPGPTLSFPLPEQRTRKRGG